MDESEYIGNWVETKTTLSEWLEHRNFDHWEVLNELGLSESQIENIENHQFSLFNEAVQNSVISMINSYPDVVKNIVFTEHLRILDLFLNSTKVEKFLIELLKPIVNIREQDYLGILKEYQNVIARKYNDFETDFNIFQKGSFLTGLRFTASIIFDYKSAIEKHLKALPPQPIAKQNDKLSDLITHQKSVEIVEGIKNRYKNIKGKRLKLLLLALQELNLLPKERIAKKFYNCCKAEFGWDVATYPAMNDYQFNEYTDKIELDNMKKFLEEIIQTK